MIFLYNISIEENDKLYGPGRRIVIWTKGCSIGCYGCTSQHLWTRENSKIMTSQELINYCLDQNQIEGLTLHGGEPTEQMDALLPVLNEVRKHGMSVILFTGREIESFVSEKEKDFITLCDIVKCGPFDISKINIFLHFRGSTNQRIIKITDRYKDYVIEDGENVVILEIDKNGILVNKGFPDQNIEKMIGEFSIRMETKHDSERKT